MPDIKRCEDCPLYKRIDEYEGMGGSYDACIAIDPLYGRPVNAYLAYRGRPDWYSTSRYSGKSWLSVQQL